MSSFLPLQRDKETLIQCKKLLQTIKAKNTDVLQWCEIQDALCCIEEAIMRYEKYE